MKVYNQDGVEAYADKDQLDTLLGAGWTRKKPTAKKVEAAAPEVEAEDEVLEDEATEEEVKDTKIRKTIKKVK